jgi:hypothetical protein
MALPAPKVRCNAGVASTKSRQLIWGGRIKLAKMQAEDARKRAVEAAAREADHAEAEAWSIRMQGYGGPAQPSPTIGQCINGGLGAGLRSNAIAARPERAFPSMRSVARAIRPCGSLRRRSSAGHAARRYAAPVHMIKLTARRENLTLFLGHPDEEL